LGLRVQTDFKTNVTTLVPKSNFSLPEDVLLFIDEASYIDSQLLSLVFSRTRNCKVIFIGDPAQLTPVKATSTPVFEAGFSGAALTTVVRQAEGNPIVDLYTKFRETVTTGDFFGFTPDGHHVQRLERAAFNAAIEAEFTRPDWRYADSKILGWTNKCVIGYNQYVRGLAKGDPHFQEGDYAVCNSFLSINGKSFKTDQLVQITEIECDSDHHDVRGNWMTMDHSIRAFQPKSLADKNARIKRARAENEINLVAQIETTWVDLRGAYACTINKAQGSTFGSVFIDLDDVSRCNSGDQIARMLYVAVSRARNHVYLTGDLA
jgi:ATP-dependent exoDNAse (exonuclease V) alpha subunit